MSRDVEPEGNNTISPTSLAHDEHNPHDQAQDQPDNEPSTSQPKSKRRKTSKPSVLASFTIRNPTWSYIHLTHLSSSSQIPLSETNNSHDQFISTSPSIDAITARLQLQASLQQFLGLHGTAIPIDVLKIEGRQVWIRVPREDVSAVVTAVGGWVGKGGEGWRVHSWGCWGARDAGDGSDLFD